MSNPRFADLRSTMCCARCAKAATRGPTRDNHQGQASWGLRQPAAVHPRASARIMSAAFSPIMIAVALVLPEMIFGMTDASTTRRP